ncbi:hypothetical protein HMPREF0083_00165 [Aneurinibacillus aneurinilyticus ATCC 12856]|uniref:Uncharacterized protein n=1 Tax=Aneurinibacillus aneurinilyticus ATCC 12856 TaxID=649747 RepID=U1XB19_ANEAE|nr:hypothetical protein HMPREF0083_00165 [Aneurinibacillus aneurinilyticus ATCC 12856]
MIRKEIGKYVYSAIRKSKRKSKRKREVGRSKGAPFLFSLYFVCFYIV